MTYVILCFDLITIPHDTTSQYKAKNHNRSLARSLPSVRRVRNASGHDSISIADRLSARHIDILMFPRASRPPVEFPPPHTTQSTVKISCQQITSGLCWDFDRHTFIPPEDVFPGSMKCGRKESGEKIKRACCQLSSLRQAPGEREQVMLGPELRAVHQGLTHASSARPEKWMGAERGKRYNESQRRWEKKRACPFDLC